MSLELDSLTFDCSRPTTVAAFWAAALGFELDPESSDEEGAWIADPTGRLRGMFFQPVPESKIAKNRLHMDLRPATSMDAEVERLTGLGAAVVGRVDEDGSFWTVMRDVEGNELCVLRGPDDGWAREAADADGLPWTSQAGPSAIPTPPAEP